MTSEYIKQKLSERETINKSTIIMGKFNTSLKGINTQSLDYTVNQFEMCI